MDRLQKIYRLHGILRAHRFPVSLASITQQLECSRATANRVIQEMRDSLQAPLLYHRELNGYHYGDDRYELPGLWFSADEILALLSAQKLLTETGAGLLDAPLAPLRRRIDQLLQSAHINNNELHRIRILPMASRRADNSAFQIIAGALLQRQRLEIGYRTRNDNSESSRVLSPQRLAHYRDNWYLDAWCHERHALRSFAVDRIHRVKKLEMSADDIAEDQLDAYFAEGYGIFAGAAKSVAILRFTPQRACWVADECWHPKQLGHFLDNGEYELHVPYADARELVMDILRHVPEVEVVAPEALRQLVYSRLSAALQRFAEKS